MAKPKFFAFKINDGDPVRLATAIRDLVQALEPLTDVECADVLRAVTEMYGSPVATSPPLIEADRREWHPGFDCPECGHRHAGADLGSICVGCPCPSRGAAPSVARG